jgi:hypothetical protein
MLLVSFGSDNDLLAAALLALGMVTALPLALSGVISGLARRRSPQAFTLGLAGGGVGLGVAWAVLWLGGWPGVTVPGARLVLALLVAPLGLGALAVLLSYRPAREGPSTQPESPTRGAVERAIELLEARFSSPTDEGGGPVLPAAALRSLTERKAPSAPLGPRDRADSD